MHYLMLFLWLFITPGAAIAQTGLDPATHSTREVIEYAVSQFPDSLRAEWNRRIARPPQAGETRKFYGQMGFNMSGRDGGLGIELFFEQFEAKFYGAAENTYVFAATGYEDLAPLVFLVMPQTVEKSQRHWGKPDFDIDNDPNVYVVLYRFAVEPGMAGYVNNHDLAPISEESNGAEIIYINPEQARGPGIDRVLAHEYGHILQISHDWVDEIWLMEGLAELNEYLLGFTPYQTGEVDQFLNWNYDLDSYGSAFKFFRFLYIEYKLHENLKELIADPADGRESIARVIGKPWNQIWSEYLRTTAVVSMSWGTIKSLMRR